MIDKTAIIHPNAEIAEGVTIGPFVVIGENVKIGTGTKIVSGVHLEHCEIGENCTISPFSTIGTEPQDLGYNGEDTKVIIGDNVIIKENVTVHRAANAGDMTTRVGNKCLLMAGSHVAHNCVLADEVIMANLATLGGHCHVGSGAFLGGMSVFHQNIRIGEMAIVSGFSAARQDVLPYTKGEGRPPYPRAINMIALKRRGVSQEDRTILNNAFKVIISCKYNAKDSVKYIRENLPTNKYVDTMLDFIESSTRGVTLNLSKNKDKSVGL